MKQCGGVILPRLVDPVGLKELGTRRGIFLSPASKRGLVEEMPIDEPLLLIGPEGGFSPAEEKLFSEWGWSGYGLGPRILRTGTAMVVVSGIVAQGML